MLIHRPASCFPLILSAVFIFLFLPQDSPCAEKYFKTPADAEGPFYPLKRRADEDNDLLHVTGHNQAARGEILRLSGRVIDGNGNPFPQAVIEIWQTDPAGRYQDRRDSSPGKRDPDFQYWGKAVAASDGSFAFTTLVPGTYKPRPAHIHFKVWIDGTVRLTSQIYFRNKSAGAVNRFSQHVAPNLQTLDLVPNTTGEYEAFFQIVL